MQAALISLFAALPVFGFVAFVLWLGASQARAKIRHRAEMQKELIAKFSSPEELKDFLNSDAGKLLVSGTTEHLAPPRPFHEQVGITVAWGVLLSCVGAALLIVRSPTFLPGGAPLGALVTAVGVAFVINALLRVWITKKLRT
jgi:hypothetical protein